MLVNFSSFPNRIKIAAIALGAYLMFAGVARPEEQQKQVRINNVPARHTTEIGGAKLYAQFCAACHGMDGKGNGPAVPALKTLPTDLTLMSRNNGGDYPSSHVMNVLSNQTDYPVHGSAEMPIWGPIFKDVGGKDRTRGLLRAHNVSEYLKSIQIQ